MNKTILICSMIGVVLTTILHLMGIASIKIYGLTIILLWIVIGVVYTHFENKAKWNHGVCKSNQLSWELSDKIEYTSKSHSLIFKAGNETLITDPHDVNMGEYKVLN